MFGTGPSVFYEVHMSWLRDHFYHFVFPAFLAAGNRVEEIGPPVDVKIHPSVPDTMPTVLRKLVTLCLEHNVPWSWDVREVNVHGGTSKYRQTAALHQKILRDTVHSATIALREEKCPRLLLGGRDVWTFAVICARKEIPFLFIPELSRNVSMASEVKDFLLGKGFSGDELFLDTGFAGSIPRNLQSHFPDQQFKFRLMSQGAQAIQQIPKVVTEHLVKLEDTADLSGPPRKVVGRKTIKKLQHPNQLFPNRKKARDEALETEYLAKYWRTGTVLHDMIDIPYEVGAHLLPRTPGLMRALIPGNTVSGWIVTDGERFVHVNRHDRPHTVNTLKFETWWLGLPLSDKSPKRVVSQYLADRQTIQRAALLTAQLWYGIPYWKQKAIQRPIPPGLKQAKQTALWIDTESQGIYNTSTDYLIASSGAVTNSSITWPVSHSYAFQESQATSMMHAALTAAGAYKVKQNEWKVSHFEDASVECDHDWIGDSE